MLFLVVLVISIATLANAQCPGGSVTYYYQDLLGCSSFTGVTSQTNIIINGTDITDLTSLNNITFGSWPGTITIDNTNLSNLTGLNLLSTVSSLSLTRNHRLTTISLAFIGITTLRIINNSMVTTIDFPLLANPLTTVDISYNAKLTDIAGFNRPISISTLNLVGNGLTQLSGFNGLVSAFLSVVIVSPQLTQITGLRSLQTTTTFTISNSSVTTMPGVNIRRSTNLLLNNLPYLTDLNAFSDMSQVVTSMQIIGATSLVDYSGLKSLQAIPNIFSARGSCCPKYSDINMPFKTSSFNGCIDCVSFISITTGASNESSTPKVPFEGGVFVNISYSGSVQTVNTAVSFGGIAVNCTTYPTTISCIAPSLFTPSVVPIAVSINQRSTIATTLGIEYVTLEEYLAVTQVINDTTITASTIVIPGVIESQSAYVNYITYLTLGVMGGVIIINLLLFTLRKRITALSPCCTAMTRGKFFKPVDYYYTFIDNLASLNDTNGPLLHRRKTTFGGLMLITSMFIAICLIAVLAMQAVIDNKTSTNSLTPKIGRIASQYSGSVTLVNYNRACSTNDLTVTLSGGTSSLTSTLTLTPDGCRVDWSTQGDFPSNNGKLSIVSKDINSLTLGFVWSLQSIDYFGNPSTTSGSMVGGIFKGSPSVININLIPSRYSGYQITPSMGILSSVDSQVPNVVKQLQDGYGVSAVFNLNINPSDLNVIVTIKQSVLSLLGIGLSIISGCFTVGKILNIIYHKVKRRTPETRSSVNVESPKVDGQTVGSSGIIDDKSIESVV